MNFKSFIQSSFGLGVFIFIFSYLIQIALNFMGISGAASIASITGSFSGAMIFTYYFYPHQMSRIFKVYAVLTIFALSLIALILAMIATGAWDILLANIPDTFSDPKLVMAIIGAILFSSVFQGLLLYFGIRFGNKEALKIVEKSKN